MSKLEDIFGVAVSLIALFFAYLIVFFGAFFWHTHDLRFIILLAESAIIDICLWALVYTNKNWSCIRYT
jgi:hypothetical protein